MLNELQQSLDLIVFQTQKNYPTLLTILGVVWGAFLLCVISGYRLLYLGIVPRTSYGLRGIFFAPFLHAGFNHVFFNSIPLIVLSNFLLFNGLEYFLSITAWIIVLSGLLTWIIAKPGIHVGASAVITGYWAVLVMNTFQQNSLTSIILGLLTIYYFAGIFFGVFPSGQKGVSWEGHLCGLVAGIIVNSYLLIMP